MPVPLLVALLVLAASAALLAVVLGSRGAAAPGAAPPPGSPPPAPPDLDGVPSPLPCVPQRAAPGGAVDRGRLAGARVLVVDDTPANLRLASLVLRRAGAEVTEAVHGAEALERWDAAGAAGFELVLMDVQMPVLDGPAAAAELRRRGATCPIVALTADGLAGPAARFAALGFDGHATKPLSRDELLDVAARHLAGNGSDDPSDRSRPRPAATLAGPLAEPRGPGAVCPPAVSASADPPPGPGAGARVPGGRTRRG